MPRTGPRVPNKAATPMHHIQILRSVTAAVSRSLNLKEVLHKSLSALTRVTGHELASLHLLSADGRELLLRGDRGFSSRLRDVNQVLPLGQGLIGRVALSGRVRHFRHVAKAADLLPAAREVVLKDGIRGFVCVPIRARQRILGTLSL